LRSADALGFWGVEGAEAGAIIPGELAGVGFHGLGIFVNVVRGR